MARFLKRLPERAVTAPADVRNLFTVMQPMENAQSTSGSAIEVRGLRKRFGPVEALRGISFEVRAGELFGFLGPNGAGKTTTINLLTGLARPDEGRIFIAGVDCARSPKAAQRLIGVVPDESNLYPELTGFENLCFCASLYGIGKREREAKARELLEVFELEEAGGRLFRTYSKGMKRKLCIAAGIIHNPPLLFLDEPTTGIDVTSAREIRKLIARWNESGKTVFLTTHYLEEAQRLCKRVAFIAKGEIVRIDRMENLLAPEKSRRVIEIDCVQPAGFALSLLRSRFPEVRFSRPAAFRIRAEGGKDLRAGLLVRALEEAGFPVLEAKSIRPSLEDIFVELTGSGAQEGRAESGEGPGEENMGGSP